MAKYALIKNGAVDNTIKYNGFDPYSPSGATLLSLASLQYVGIGWLPHDRGGNSYTHNIVIDGNSLAVGFSGTTNKACEQAVIDAGFTVYDYVNRARSGAATQTLIMESNYKVDMLYESATSKNVVIFWEGINDIWFGSNDTTAYNNLKSYCQDRVNHGWKVVLGTLTPATRYSGTQETYRMSVNTMIRDAKAANETWLHAVADVGGDATIGVTGAAASATYYSDGLHLTNAGHAIASTYFKDALLSVL